MLSSQIVYGFIPGKHSVSYFRSRFSDDLPTDYNTVLGALSKSIATLTTQPLIVAKVGLQSRPPPAREGKPFKSFVEVMTYIIEHEGPLALFKGIGPQLLKGLLVQGLLMMTKERVELLFVLLFAYMRASKARRLKAACPQACTRSSDNRPPMRGDTSSSEMASHNHGDH